MNHSLWEILNMAGYAMWAILFLSILAVAVALERIILQWRFLDRARALHDVVARCLGRGALSEGRSACERSQSPLADVYLIGYERLGRSKLEHLVSAVNRERIRVMAGMKTRLWMLGTTGAIAVFVGLFGTVVGIMSAFNVIAETGKNDFALVATPIAEALYATAAGILVAVEAVILYNFFNQRLARFAIEVRMLTEEFLELLEEQGPEQRGESDEESGDGSRKAA